MRGLMRIISERHSNGGASFIRIHAETDGK